jgi:hypothetical protein
MEKFKPNKRRFSIGMLIISIVFLLAGTGLVIAANWFPFITWLQKCGIAVVVAFGPIVVILIYLLVRKKIKEM